MRRGFWGDSIPFRIISFLKLSLLHITHHRPLVDASLTRTNVTLVARLDPSSSDGMFASTSTKQGSHHGQDEKLLSHEEGNKLHFEFVLATKVQNTKHAKMEDFLEPISAYGNLSYALKEMPVAGGETEKVDTREVSCKIMLPKFLSINVSPSALDTATKLNEIVNQSSLDVYESLSMDLQIEGVRDLWNFLDKVRLLLPNFFAFLLLDLRSYVFSF